MKIGLAQTNIYWEDKEKNKAQCLEMVAKAKTKQVDFIVFPEMTLTGFSMNTSLIAEEQENSDTIAFFQQIAKQYQIAINFGVVIKKEIKAANKSIIVDKTGVIQADYNKIHPFSFGEEQTHYIGGDSLCYCQIGDMILSPLICYDLRFPEIFQICSKKSNLITVIANWPALRRGHWITLLKARAVENQCFIAGVNRFGSGNGLDYSGDSLIVNPYGEIITQCMSHAGLITADIDSSLVKEYRSAFQLKEDRREDLYIELYKNKK